VSAFQVVSSVFYVTTYEGVRHMCDNSRLLAGNSAAKAFLGGGAASVVGQTIIVPFDVIR
jgi:solute carrier family 25 protein 44